MPEGDTVHKLAQVLEERLVGRSVDEIKLRRPARDQSLYGRRVTRVYARGKHLFMILDGVLVVRSHLGMYGSWHHYARHESWRKPRHQASLVLALRDEVFVCFNARELECRREQAIDTRNLLQRLGPDLLSIDWRVELVVQRAQEFLDPTTELVDLLLDQRIASGIGNVYKSEVLFITGHNPTIKLGWLDSREIARLYETARELLARNLGGEPRRTRPATEGGDRLWVYGRGGRPCFRCGNLIIGESMGRQLRPTFWCPDCQQRQPQDDRP